MVALESMAPVTRDELYAQLTSLVSGDDKPYFAAVKNMAKITFEIFDSVRQSQAFQASQPSDFLQIKGSPYSTGLEETAMKVLYKGPGRWDEEFQMPTAETPADVQEVLNSDIWPQLKAMVTVLASPGWPLLRQAVDAVAAFEEDTSRPIAEITALLANGDWTKWRAIFSVTNLNNALKIAQFGVETIEFVELRFFSHVAHRFGLSVVNKKNGLTEGQPPPYVLPTQAARARSVADSIFLCSWRTVLAMLFASRKVSTRLRSTDAAYLADKAVTGEWSDLGVKRVSTQIDTVKAAWDDSVRRAITQVSVSAASGAGPSGATLAAPVQQVEGVQTHRWDTGFVKSVLRDEVASIAWMRKLTEYRAHSRAVLSAVRAEGAVTLFPALRADDVKYQRRSGVFSAFVNPPTNLDFLGSKLPIPDYATWMIYVDAFEDPVVVWIRSRADEARAVEANLGSLLIHESQIADKTSTDAKTLAGLIRNRISEAKTQLESASAFNTRFLLNDSDEILRRLQLYESQPLWDTLLGLAEPIFLEEKEYGIAANTLAIFDKMQQLRLATERGSHRTGSLSQGIEEGTARLAAIVGQPQANEIRADLERVLPDYARTRSMQLIGAIERTQSALEAKQEEYAAFVMQNAPRLACSEIAARMLRFHLTQRENPPNYPTLATYMRASYGRVPVRGRDDDDAEQQPSKKQALPSSPYSPSDSEAAINASILAVISDFFGDSSQLQLQLSTPVRSSEPDSATVQLPVDAPLPSPSDVAQILFRKLAALGI